MPASTSALCVVPSSVDFAYVKFPVASYNIRLALPPAIGLKTFLMYLSTVSKVILLSLLTSFYKYRTFAGKDPPLVGS